ncbi:MAG: bifunctional proline dehydrogenase/L-glutamate gamma-semialdehyde dehydrogenase PutA, partial [Rhodocyclaceae bacterium]|nr:bifunctional proline dehydrogenase/L-glutamate gamma-semialdehyde dehydrogenase PutA [Rhodocyclaceae bacterium]
MALDAQQRDAAALSPKPADPLRQAIDAACRTPEPDCVPPLIAAARMPPELARQVHDLARTLVIGLRERRRRAGGVDALMKEFALSSHEGVALMCLAEALLRVPDRDTADRLIRDKLKDGDWRAHLGHSPSMFVNAASWGLLITGRLVATHSEDGLGAALGRLLVRGGEPLIRAGMDLAMRLLGEQFVAGRDIDEALHRADAAHARGYRHSFDMLGEAAMSADDATRYLAQYTRAIHAIGQRAGGRGVVDGDGISVKLSALHPRYLWSQRARVMAELLPRLRELCLLARDYDIGLNIDAEEADRLDLSLDLLDALACDPALAGWDGLGFVVQAYQKRAPRVIEFIVDLARRNGRRLMLRLVKGAYWDAEIKRAQLDGLAGYPVFTRKAYTDVSYLACARMLLGARAHIYPQFATHNAHTVAAVYHLAGGDGRDYEFQCLHGMGETLYDQVLGSDRLGRRVRIYAPVGSHRTLLAYLVRRLLENGANASFVNQVVDENLPVDALIADPVDLAATHAGAPHPRIPLPPALYGTARRNAAGFDLASESVREMFAEALRAGRETAGSAAPMVVGPARSAQPAREVRNPADGRDVVGAAVDADPAQVDAALQAAAECAPQWAATAPAERAAMLRRAADALEADAPQLVALLVREAGKTWGNALAEVREAVDFCRYYAA